jgi:hypothetical protein
MHSNVLTRDGQVIGFWRTAPHPDEALVDVHLSRPLDAATRSALEEELARYGRFMRLPTRLVVKAASAGPRRAQKRQA